MMKKLIALILALVLLLGVAAWAEELPYIRELEQYSYIMEMLLTEESYPQVCLMDSYASRYFYDDGTEPLFMCFPGPDNAQCLSFDASSASYVDLDQNIVYTYAIHGSDSYEEFLNEAELDEYIILDGSDGAAAYIDPSDYSFCAYGMLPAKEFGKSAKLVFRITLNNLDRKMPMETRITALTEAITAEVARVQSSVHMETYAPYWSYNKFAGAKMLDYDFQRLFVFDFLPLPANVKDVGVVEAPLAVNRVDGNRMSGIYSYGGRAYVDADISIDSYSFPSYKLEEADENAERITLDNGSEWLLYIGYYNSDGSVGFWYASKPIEGFTDQYDKQMYVNLEFNGSNVSWATKDDCLQIMKAFDTNLRIITPQEDPYVAPEKPEETVEQPDAPAEDAPVADAGAWTCADCGTENTGNFCTNCGAAKPENGPWACPQCGAENEGNFCSNCGTAKP